jgi:endonuclease/exonuclease/phosphatase family metal-dependent hydrolase
MKYTLWIGAFLCMAIFPSFAGKPGDTRVMTFNIRYNNPSDSIYAWDARKTMVLKVIRVSKPGIIGLQEVLRGQLDDLIKGLPGYSAFGVGRDDGKNAGEFSPVLFDTTLYRLLNGSVFWISRTPHVPGSVSWNTACTRIITWVCLKDKVSQDTLYVFNTHFDHISEEARVHGAEMLVAAADSLGGDKPVIITGDFNSTDSTRAYQVITCGNHIPLYDTRSSLKEQPAINTTFIGFPANLRKREVIDFIFINKRFKTLDYRVISYNINGKYPSDHLPVLVNLELK